MRRLSPHSRAKSRCNEWLIVAVTVIFVEVLDLQALFDPFQVDISGRFYADEEMQEPAKFHKAELSFPSGEVLPLCWLEGKYRKVE